MPTPTSRISDACSKMTELDAAPVKHERERQSADARARNEHLHGSVPPLMRMGYFASSGGGRKSTSCLADSATTSAGVCSGMLWIAQNRS